MKIRTPFLYSLVIGLLGFSAAYAKDVALKQTREIALSFDDCPRKLGGQTTGMERARKLVDGLKAAGVEQAVFFCNSPSRSLDGAERIKFFADQGHLIANHTADHPNLNKTTPEEFIKNIAKADEELRGFPNFRKWFRFPYLREGATPKDVVTVREYLRKTGYRNGYVTVNIEDWAANEILVKAIAEGETWDEKHLCQTYTSIVVEEAEFYDRMSVGALGRSVKHVALLHETDINALCITEVVKGLNARGWKIITADAAYADPIAEREPSENVSLVWGRVFALAKEKGYKGPYESKWSYQDEIENEFKRRKVFQKRL